ncbi:hypothetical protein ACFOY4_33575 [Actinomadura syzygii]|uniref:Uncharacterized protein n=1 Tax=Actinomadura syzygii TaxID=1427538 RepID=A0A5D0UD34_9ACTN|nr:hypothetical protein [Actinomadura syzygii]TYC15009.1 hypothetical protein FXF65_12835 [Actinomadura syzygii]
MNGPIETSESNRAFGPFPAEWGTPAGARFSEERTRWVAERVREHRALQAVRRRAAAEQRLGAEHVRRALRLLQLRKEGP